MNYWLAQLILAARSRDDRDGGWMQILVFVILAVFYAVGSIVKAKANKTALKDEKQKIPRKPARKPPEGTRELFKQSQRPARPAPHGQPRPQMTKLQVQPPRRRVARPATARSAVTSPQPAVGRKLPTKAEEAIELPTLEPLGLRQGLRPDELEVSKMGVLEPQVQPKFEELPELTTKVEGLKEKRVAMPAEIQPAKYLSEILSDYDDPEKLRRAILHYEILGKPLSLREQERLF